MVELSQYIQRKDNSVFSPFSFTLAFYPWLYCYATFVNGVTLGDALLIISLILEIFQTNVDSIDISGANKIYVLFYAYCILSVIIATFTYKRMMVSLITIRFLKYGYFMVVIFHYSKLIKKDQFISGYKILIYMLTSGLVLQYICRYVFGFILQLKIPFLSYCNDLAESIDYTTKLMADFRPNSLLLEPAGVTYVLCTYLVYLLFEKSESKSRRVEIIICTLASLMTVSSSSIVLLIIIYVCYVLRVITHAEYDFTHKMGYIIIFVITAVIIVCLYMSTPLVNSMNRMMYSSNSIQAESVWSRLTNGEELIRSMNGISRIFGVGLGNIDLYTNSISYLIYCTGYIGLAIMFFWAIVSLNNSNIAGKVLVIVFVALWFSSRVIISGDILIFNAFLLFYNKKNKIRINENYLENASKYIK